LTPAGLDWQIRSTLAVMTLAIILWVLEPIPLALSALVAVVAMVATGAAPLEGALSGFASGSTFLIAAGFMMAKAINSTPLGNRIAYFFLAKTKNTPAGILAAILIIMEVLTFFIPATAVRAALLLPVILSIIEEFELKMPVPNIRTMLLLGIAFGANITGLGLLPGAIANVITVELLQHLTGVTITYVDWLLYAFPISIVLLPVIWVVLVKSFPPEIKEFPGGQVVFKNRLRELGPVSAAEKRCLGILLFTFALWMTEGWHGLHSSIPAIIAVILMCLPGIGCSRWERTMQISWDSIILVAITLSLGNAANQGAAQFIAGSFFGLDIMAGVFIYPVVTIILLVLFTQLYHLVIGNVATVTITLVPIVYQMSLYFGGDPFLMALATGIASLFGFVLVVETIPNVVVYNTGLINSKDLIIPGIILTAAVSVVMGIMAAIWWPLVTSFF
ncbi:MAG: DASS family sodium-coupled anion symporter, partial [Bacillota bacterium]